MYVGGLEVEEVEEGGVVHGERGPRRDLVVVIFKQTQKNTPL